MTDETAEVDGYTKFRASALPAEQQERLRKVLKHELVSAMIQAVRANPPEVDLAGVELVLRPGQTVGDWSPVADCGTCGTCGTSGGCGTCGTT